MRILISRPDFSMVECQTSSLHTFATLALHQRYGNSRLLRSFAAEADLVRFASCTYDSRLRVTAVFSFRGGACCIMHDAGCT